jgi:protein-S-isoprenylcysteine O-methyltransferase Ste14
MSCAPSPARPAAARRGGPLILGYAVAAYLFSFAVLVYAAGFLANVGVPAGMDGSARSGWPAAAFTDLALVAVFAAQHSVMARPWFKRRWTAVVPESAERATYVLCSGLALGLLEWLWRPMGDTVWRASGPGRAALLACAAAGWALAIGATFAISHTDLFGLRQAWLHARGARYRSPPFTERGLYRRVRHPLMSGFLVIIWATPVMTIGHLAFAAAVTGYILVGIRLEERDLIRGLGDAYRRYRARVPALIPVHGPVSAKKSNHQGNAT